MFQDADRQKLNSSTTVISACGTAPVPTTAVGYIYQPLHMHTRVCIITFFLAKKYASLYHRTHKADLQGKRVSIITQVMQEEQKLMVEFQDYPNVLIRMLNNCIKEPHSHLVVFVMQHDINARLDFIQVGLVCA